MLCYIGHDAWIAVNAGDSSVGASTAAGGGSLLGRVGGVNQQSSTAATDSTKEPVQVRLCRTYIYICLFLLGARFFTHFPSSLSYYCCGKVLYFMLSLRKCWLQAFPGSAHSTGGGGRKLSADEIAARRLAALSGGSSV